MNDAENPTYLSPREQQILDAAYRAGESGLTATDAQAALLPDKVSNSAVRTHLRILEEKGHLRHETVGARYVYLPTRPANDAARSALSRVVNTFFANSAARAALTLLSPDEAKTLSDTELDRLQALIDAARKEGR